MRGKKVKRCAPVTALEKAHATSAPAVFTAVGVTSARRAPAAPAAASHAAAAMGVAVAVMPRAERYEYDTGMNDTGIQI